MKKNDETLYPHKNLLNGLQQFWKTNENIIWIGSTLKLIRNIDKFKYPQKLDTERKKQLLSLILKALLGSSNSKKHKALFAHEMHPIEKEFLLEHFLQFENFQEAQHGVGFIINTTGNFLATINSKDHLCLEYIDSTGDLEETWQKIVELEQELCSTLSFAFSEKFGFLTSDPLICGTGFLLSSFLHLPALIHGDPLFSEYSEKERSEGLLVSGLHGNPDEIIGDILMLRNRYTIEVSEETTLSTLRNSILRLVLREKHMRSAIKAEKNDKFIDLISRALGLLKFSFKLETREALSALSLIKLGIELCWITGISLKDINWLFFQSRKAHILISHTHEISTEPAVLRANYLKTAFEKALLHIS